jgi:hypothetical protein
LFRHKDPMITKIWVTAQFEGFHKWPEAPIAQSFLSNLHRHIFHVKATFWVDGMERELEFFEVKTRLQVLIEKLKEHLSKNPGMSCENMAYKLLDFLSKDDLWVQSVEVSEDGENGAIIERTIQEMNALI